MPSINDSKCVLVTGATAGIGRSLALSIAKLPSKPTVIAAGRRPERLEDLAKQNFETLTLEMDSDKETIKKYVDHILVKYPELDTVILNAGVQYEFDFAKPGEIELDSLYKEFNVNYLSVVAFITSLLPHFLKLSAQGRPTFIVTVTSGLGVLPLPSVINYSATKAALRSFTVSLQAQLKDTNVHVLEIIPPLVESELHDAQGKSEALSKFWVPLDEFTKEVMTGLTNGDSQIAVGTAKKLFEQFDKPKIEMVFAMASGKPFNELEKK